MNASHTGISFNDFCLMSSPCLDPSDQLFASYVLIGLTGAVVGAAAYNVWEKFIYTLPSMKRGSDAQ